MPHTSAPNTSARWRRALFGVYNAASRGELRTRYYEAGRADGARWGYTQANPDGKGPRLTAGVDGTGEAVLEHPRARGRGELPTLGLLHLQTPSLSCLI